MNKSYIIILSVLLFIVACGNQQAKTPPQISGVAKIVKDTAKQQDTSSFVKDTTNLSKVGKYFCPMKCEKDKMYDHPGRCPVCKMELRQWKATKN